MPETDLQAIKTQISAQMSSDPTSGIVSVGTDDLLPRVEVGVTDPDSATASGLRARYGAAVHVFLDDALESLAGNPDRPPVDGADTYRDPMLAGMHIYGGGEDCTAGFMYRGHLDISNSSAKGIFTAGHCFEGQPTLTHWYQGGRQVGTFSRHRFVRVTYADAGTLTTEFDDGSGGWREISNRVFVGVGSPTLPITSIAGSGTGKRGDTACISGAYGGMHCGDLDKVGRKTAGGHHMGFDYQLDGRTIRYTYRFRLDDGSCQKGDSGAPVFNFSGKALGIAFARKPRQPNLCYFSQMGNVEYEMRVPMYKGG